MAGYIKGRWYDTRQSFTVAAYFDGSSTSTSSNKGAKELWAGNTAWYIKHSQGAVCPIAVCTTNHSWVDGWYDLCIMPAATYPVYLNANGGTGVASSLTKTWGVNLTLPEPTRASTTSTGYKVTYYPGNGGSSTSATATDTTTYTFSVWKNSDGGTVAQPYTDNGSDYNVGAPSSVTFTAEWVDTFTRGSVTLPTPTWANTSSSGTITYNASTNGGTTTKASEEFSTSTTHTFNGWYTASSGGTKVGNAGASYQPSAATNLYGQWTNKTTGSSTVTLPTASKAKSTSNRTVTINANGGSSTVTSRTSSATITYSSTGWWTAASGGTKVGNNGATITPSTAPITYYAQFSSSTGSYSAVTLPTTAQCTRANHTLKGFSTSSTATTATYAPGASFTPSSNTTLYAVWESLVGNVYVKKDGAWVQAKAVYTKVNGSWV